MRLLDIRCPLVRVCTCVSNIEPKDRTAPISNDFAMRYIFAVPFVGRLVNTLGIRLVMCL